MIMAKLACITMSSGNTKNQTSTHPIISNKSFFSPITSVSTRWLETNKLKSVPFTMRVLSSSGKSNASSCTLLRLNSEKSLSKCTASSPDKHRSCSETEVPSTKMVCPEIQFPYSSSYKYNRLVTRSSLTPTDTHSVYVRSAKRSASSTNMSSIRSSPKYFASKPIRSTSAEFNELSAKMLPSGSSSGTCFGKFIPSSSYTLTSTQTRVSFATIPSLQLDTKTTLPPRLYKPRCARSFSVPTSMSPLQSSTETGLPAFIHTNDIHSSSKKSVSASSARMSNKSLSSERNIFLATSTNSSSLESGHKSPVRLSPLSFDGLSSSSSFEESDDEEMETVFQEIHNAESESRATKSLMPLIKQELKTKIQLERLLAGKEELEVDFTHSKSEMTLEDLQKRESKREQNRISALRSRNKQRQSEEKIEKEYQKVDSTRQRLELERTQLLWEKQRLSATLFSHLLEECRADCRDEDLESVIKLTPSPLNLS